MPGFSQSINLIASGNKKFKQASKNEANPAPMQTGGGKMSKKRPAQIEIERSKPKSKKRKVKS